MGAIFRENVSVDEEVGIRHYVIEVVSVSGLISDLEIDEYRNHDKPTL